MARAINSDRSVEKVLVQCDFFRSTRGFIASDASQIAKLGLIKIYADDRSGGKLNKKVDL